MMGLLLASALCLGAEFFDLSVLPVEDPSTQCFLARGIAGRADLFLLSGNRLTHVPSAKVERAHVLRLDEGVSAFDMADLDGDGIPALIVVRGTTIGQIPPDGSDEELQPLFEAETLFAKQYRPFPHVLAVHHGEGMVLALPRADGLELRQADGALVARYPMAQAGTPSLSFGPPFRARPARPAQIATDEGFELAVNAMRAYRPDLPEDLFPSSKHAAPLYRRGTPRQSREAAGQPAEAWPWFPLMAEGAGNARAYHAQAKEKTTVVRIRMPASGDGDAGMRLGPERRYPGQLLLVEGRLPDFDGDGHTDLLTWQAAEPALSVGVLVRGLSARHWPIRISPHLFDPKKGRFAPRAAGVVVVDAPVRWMLEQPGEPPLRRVVLDDLDGDGKTDIAFSPAPRVFAAWRAGEDGFRGEPDFEHRFEEAIEEIAFHADLSGHGQLSIGLRGARHLYLLHPAAPTP